MVSIVDQSLYQVVLIWRLHCNTWGGSCPDYPRNTARL